MTAKRLALAVGVIGLLVVVLWVGAAFLSGPKAQATSGPGQKWEYLVVSTGRVYWVGGLLGSAKDLRKAVGMGDYHLQESVGAEELFDNFGRVGWELVAVVGLVGGDQEFVFKRPLP